MSWNIRQLEAPFQSGGDRPLYAGRLLRGVRGRPTVACASVAWLRRVRVEAGPAKAPSCGRSFIPNRFKYTFSPLVGWVEERARLLGTPRSGLDGGRLIGKQISPSEDAVFPSMQLYASSKTVHGRSCPGAPKDRFKAPRADGWGERTSRATRWL